MRFEQQITERRKLDRLEVRREAFALLCPQSVLGRILNVNEQGACVCYTSDQVRKNESFKMTISSVDGSFDLENITFKDLEGNLVHGGLS